MSLFGRIVIKTVTPVLDLAYSVQKVPETWAASVLSDLSVAAKCGASVVLSKGAGYTTLEEWSELFRISGKSIYQVIAKFSMHPLYNTVNGSPKGNSDCDTGDVQIPPI